jgi:hypothetical protein
VVRMAARVAAFALLALALALGGCTRAAPSRAAASVAPGVDATGRQDVTSRLQDLINNLPDGSTLKFPPRGSYLVNGTIHVKNRTDLIIEGNGSVFTAKTLGDRTRSVWSFEGGSHIVVRDVVVKGANANAGMSGDAYVSKLEAQHAFNIVSTNGIELDHVTATDVYGDFVYVGRMNKGGLAKNVYIHDSTFSRNGRQGISVTGGDGVRIIGNTIGDTRRATFDLEPNGPTWGALNVDIEHNTIGSGRLMLLSAGGVGPVSNLTFSHNTINRGAIMWVKDSKGGRRGPITISDNTSTRPWGGPAGQGLLNFVNVDGVTVTGNSLQLQPNRRDVGVRTIGSCDVVVKDNTFRNAVAPLAVTKTAGTACASTGNVSPSPTPSPSRPAPSAAPTPAGGSAPSSTPRPATRAPSHPTSKAPAPVVATVAKPTRPTSSYRPLSAAKPKAVAVVVKRPAAANQAAAALPGISFREEQNAPQSSTALRLGVLAASLGAGVVGFRRRPLLTPPGSRGVRHSSGHRSTTRTVDVLPRHRAR